MAAPNPQLRIAPSGPLTGSTTEPLAQFAGATYQAFEDTDLEIGVAGSIGPDGGLPADGPSLYLARANVAPTVPFANEALLRPVNGTLDYFNFGLTQGLWEVEAELVAIYFTGEAPTALTDSGQLEVTPIAIFDDGSTSIIGASNVSLITREAAAATSPRSSNVKIVFEVTDSMVITDNGGQPITGFALRLTRQTSLATQWGAYSAASGTLRILTDSSVSIRKVR